MYRFILLTLAILAPIGQNATAEHFEEIQNLSTPTGSSIIRGSGVFGFDDRYYVTGKHFVIGENGVELQVWQQRPQIETIVTDADQDHLVLLEGTSENDTDEDTWFTQALVVRSPSDGRLIFSTPVLGTLDLKIARLVDFRGTRAVAVQVKNGLQIYDANSGTLLATEAIPSDVTILDYVRWGTWSNVSRAEIPKYDNFTQTVFGPNGSTYWAFPGGLIVATSGDQTLWTIDLGQRVDGSGRYKSYQSFPSDIELVAGRYLVVTFRTADDRTYTETQVINIASGTVEKTLPHATAVASDEGHIYLRQTNGVQAYDVQTLDPIWNLSRTRVYRENTSFMIDDNYIYTTGASMEDEDDSDSNGCIDRRAQELLLIDKRTGERKAAFKLANRVDGIFLGNFPGTVFVDRSSYVRFDDGVGCYLKGRAVLLKVVQ